MTKKSVDSLLEPRTDDMLEDLGLSVHFVPRHAQNLDEKELEQAMPPHDPKCVPLPMLGESDLTILRALDQLMRFQPLEHRGDCRCRHPKVTGEAGRRDVVASSSQSEDGF